ncbi:hypothetical protein [Chitiniphilus eburneus]|uniref:hypothetical protein n=1 Tax=Chitiniphilus eburneus TaxID=2571148 RepID=UPI0035D0FB02
MHKKGPASLGLVDIAGSCGRLKWRGTTSTWWELIRGAVAERDSVPQTAIWTSKKAGRSGAGFVILRNGFLAQRRANAGFRSGFKIPRRKACRFESDPGHHQEKRGFQPRFLLSGALVQSSSTSKLQILDGSAMQPVATDGDTT